MRRTTGMSAMAMALLMNVYGFDGYAAVAIQQGSATLAQSPAATKPQRQYGGEVIVTFKEGVSKEEAESIAEALGMEVADYYQVLSERNNRPYMLLRSSMTAEEMIEKLRNHEAIEAASPNYSRKPMSSEKAEPAKNKASSDEPAIKSAPGLNLFSALLLALALVIAGVMRLANLRKER